MKILIIDDEIEVAEIIDFMVQEIFPISVQTILAHSGNTAIKMMEEQKDIDVCICDHNMADGMGTDVIKYLIDNNSKIKFVLCSTVIPSDKPKEYPGTHVFSNIQKPDIAKGIENLYKLLEAGVTEEKVVTGENFIPVSIHMLELMGKMPFDLYIRMTDDKWIKCINKSEQFIVSDKEKYQQKGLSSLFFKKGDLQISTNQIIFETIDKIMQRRHMPLASKMGLAHEQLIGLIKFTGISDELAEASKKNIKQTVELISKSPMASEFWEKINLMGEYPSKLYTLHSMLSAVIAKKMHWNTEGTLFKLTLASFLQDISLDSIALMELDDFRAFLDSETRFSRLEIKRFNEHPFKAVEILKSFKEIPPDIDRILLEQHEMPDGSGIPRKLNSNQMGPMTCTFINAGIFARHILLKGDKFKISDFVSYLEKRGYSSGNFRESFLVIKTMAN